MREFAVAVRAINVGAFAVLALFSLLRARERGDAATKWFGLAFSLLAVTGTVIVALPDVPVDPLETFIFKVTVAALMLFPYFLFRFNATFRPYSSRIRWIADLVTSVVVVLVLAIPRIIPPGEALPWWYVSMSVIVSFQWTFLIAVTVRGFWKGSSAQSTINRRRRRLLAVGAVSMNGLLVVGATGSAERGSVQDFLMLILGIAAANLFALAFYVPRWLRRLWRDSEDQLLAAAAEALMKAKSEREALDAFLPYIVSMVGAGKASVCQGNTVVAQFDASGTSASDGSRKMTFETSFGTLEVSADPYTPFFGEQDSELIEKLCLLAALSIERNRFFEAERLATEQLAEAHQIASLGTWHYEVGQDLMTWSDELFRIFGIAAVEHVPTLEGYLRHVYPGDVEYVKSRILSAVDERDPFVFEHRISRSGEIRTIQVRGRVTGNSSSNVALFGTAQDITDRKRAEANLKRLSSIVQFSDDAVYSLTLDGTVTSWNPAAEALYGYTAEEMIGSPISTIIPEDHGDEEKRLLGDVLSGRPVRHFRTTRLRSDGRAVEVSLTISLLRDSNSVPEVSVIARDMTEQTRLESLRDEFIANAAHELRTPLTALAGLALTLQDPTKRGRLTEAALNECFAAIARQGERARVLINNLLDISQLDLGRLVLQIEPTDVGALVKSVLRSTPPPNGTTVFQTFDEGLVAHTDPLRLEQIIYNLLSNAYRYGGQHIEIEARLFGEHIELSIGDDGPGVPSSFVPHLFEVFTRAEEATRGEGSGLGLAICVKLANLLGGGVTWRPNPPSGALFTLKIPLVSPRHRVKKIEEHGRI